MFKLRKLFLQKPQQSREILIKYYTLHLKIPQLCYENFCLLLIIVSILIITPDLNFNGEFML